MVVCYFILRGNCSSSPSYTLKSDIWLFYDSKLQFNLHSAFIVFLVISHMNFQHFLRSLPTIKQRENACWTPWKLNFQWRTDELQHSEAKKRICSNSTKMTAEAGEKCKTFPTKPTWLFLLIFTIISCNWAKLWKTLLTCLKIQKYAWRLTQMFS